MDSFVVYSIYSLLNSRGGRSTQIFYLSKNSNTAMYKYLLQVKVLHSKSYSSKSTWISIKIN